MVEKTGRHQAGEDRIPQDVRDHVRAAREELRESIRSLLPPEFVVHRRKARKEMLLAWRSVIDSALQKMEERDKDSA